MSDTAMSGLPIPTPPYTGSGKPFSGADMIAYARQYAAPIEAERDAMRAALEAIAEQDWWYIDPHVGGEKIYGALGQIARAALTPTTKEPKP